MQQPSSRSGMSSSASTDAALAAAEQSVEPIQRPTCSRCDIHQVQAAAPAAGGTWATSTSSMARTRCGTLSLHLQCLALAWHWHTHTHAVRSCTDHGHIRYCVAPRAALHTLPTLESAKPPGLRGCLLLADTHKHQTLRAHIIQGTCTCSTRMHATHHAHASTRPVRHGKQGTECTCPAGVAWGSIVWCCASGQR